MKAKTPKVSSGPWIFRALCQGCWGWAALCTLWQQEEFPFQNCSIPSFGLKVWVRQGYFALLHSRLLPFWEEKRGEEETLLVVPDALVCSCEHTHTQM